jgi:hypothetical protein
MKPLVALLFVASAILAACSSNSGSSEMSGSSVPPQAGSSASPATHPYTPNTDQVSPPATHQ